jgi:hypothetical protein
LPAVLYGRETWSLSLRQEHTLVVFENRMLRRIFGSRRKEIIGGSKKLYNEDLHKFYSSSNIIRILRSRKCDEQGMYS